MQRLSDWYDRLEDDGNQEIDKHIKEEFGPLLLYSCYYIRVNRKYRIFDTIRLAIMSTNLFYILFNFALTSYFVMNDLSLLGTSIAILSTMFIALVNTWLLVWERKRINRFVRMNISGFYDYQDTDKNDVVKNLKKRGRTQRLLVLILAPSWLAICVLTGFVLSPLLNKLDNPTNKININENVNTDLPVPLWLPYSVTSSSVLYISICIETTSAVFLSFSISASVTLYMYFAQQISIQLEILNDSVASLPSRATRLMEKRFPNEFRIFRSEEQYHNKIFQECVRYCLKQNAQHHQQIIRGFQIFMKICDVPLWILNTCMSLQIAVTLTVLVSSTGRYGPKMFSLTILIAELSALALVHFFGQKITDVSTLFRDHLYATEWFVYDKSIKSMLAIMQERTIQPLKILALGLSGINYETFMSICNTAYSFMNLLLAVDKK